MTLKLEAMHHYSQDLGSQLELTEKGENDWELLCCGSQQGGQWKEGSGQAKQKTGHPDGARLKTPSMEAQSSAFQTVPRRVPALHT